MSAEKLMIRPDIQALSAYHVPDSSGLQKLDAMESPYSWPEELVLEWSQRMQVVAAEINRYPDPRAQALSDTIRRVMQVPQELDIMLGNGSDEIIQMLALATASAETAVVAPVPGFVMYQMIATFTDMPYVPVELDAAFDLDVDATVTAMTRHDRSLVFLALPNNPTGNVFSRDRVQAVIDACNGIVVLDEAYSPFTDKHHMDMACTHDNVLLMRTLSKMGLAGLRLGMLFGNPALLAELDKVRLPYNVGVLAQASAEFALDHYGVFLEQAGKIRAEREVLLEALSQLSGLVPWSSEANFLLVRCRDRSADEVFEGLRDRGILIKNLHGAHPRLHQCLRLTVGTPEQNEAMLDALQELL